MTRSEADTLFRPTTHGLAARLVRAVTDVLARRRQRAELSRLDRHLLRDIGLTPEQARAECAKPFWQA